MHEDPRIAQAVDYVNALTRRRIDEWLESGAMATELSFDYEPPTVELVGENLVVSEKFRFI